MLRSLRRRVPRHTRELARESMCHVLHETSMTNESEHLTTQEMDVNQEMSVFIIKSFGDGATMQATVTPTTTAMEVKQIVENNWGIAVDWQLLHDAHGYALDDLVPMFQNGVRDGDRVFLVLVHAEHGAPATEDSSC